MTEPTLKMGPSGYKLNPKKLKGAPQYITPYLFLGAFYYTEEFEYFDVIKDYLDIPEKPKTMEEIKQELDDKFEELWVRTKLKFDISKQTSEYHYSKKFEKINKNFEYMKQWGHLPYITLVPDGQTFTNGAYLISTGNGNASWGTEFNLNPSKNSVGYYYVKPDVKFHMTKTPNIIVRFFMKNLLNFEWENRK